MRKTLRRIAEQQRAMGYTDHIDWSIENRIDYMRDITLALIKEAAEALDEIPWKPWKAIADQKFNSTEAAKEICDIFVFAFVLYLTLDPAIDIEDAMEATLTKIENRIKHGYGHQQEKNYDS